MRVMESQILDNSAQHAKQYSAKFIASLGLNDKPGITGVSSPGIEMSSTYAEQKVAKRRHRIIREKTCHCCGNEVSFCWTCRCGFGICQECMAENAWGMTCNGITWQCPDCGGYNGYGNQ